MKAPITQEEIDRRENLNNRANAISSINRTSYKNNTIGSFKESGSIEYTADYLISLEEKETSNNLAFNTDDNIITLTFLKNRFGTKDSIDLTYYGNYATFIEN